jgi:hypothetical protein
MHINLLWPKDVVGCYMSNNSELHVQISGREIDVKHFSQDENLS